MKEGWEVFQGLLGGSSSELSTNEDLKTIARRRRFIYTVGKAT